MQHSSPTAAFDFDGTLSTRDSLLDFALFSLGRPRLALACVRSTPSLLGWLIGYLSRQQLKQAFMRACWAGTCQVQLEQYAFSYATTQLPKLIRPEMLERVRAHQRLNHRLLLVSASPSLYLKHWAYAIGFEIVLATELDFSAGVFHGEFSSPNCWGEEKVRRLGHWLKDPAFELTYAYGNSLGDKEMLARSKFPWLSGVSKTLPTLSLFSEDSSGTSL